MHCHNTSMVLTSPLKAGTIGSVLACVCVCVWGGDIVHQLLGGGVTLYMGSWGYILSQLNRYKAS